MLVGGLFCRGGHLLLLLLLFGGLVSSRVSHIDAVLSDEFSSLNENNSLDEVAAAGGEVFAFQLLNACALDNLSPSENLVISPVSIFAAMGMIGLGSQGSTKEQFQNLLGERYVSHAFTQLNALQQIPAQISIANAIFQTGVVREEFTKDLKHFFDAEVRDDMNKDAINRWCAQKTSGKINQLLSDELDETAKAVLVNAVYLKAKWKKSFDKGQSHKGKFNMKHDVFYMKMDSKMRYTENELFQAVALPYEGDNLEMILVQPQPGVSLKTVVASFPKEQSSLKNLRLKEVKLSIPRMKLSYAIEMTNVLKELGLVDAFDAEKAEFPMISETPLYISEVYHKATMDVDEEGTVAAAVTAVKMMTRSKRITYTMKVNRPFLMILQTTDTQVPVFLALVNKPM